MHTPNRVQYQALYTMDAKLMTVLNGNRKNTHLIREKTYRLIFCAGTWQRCHLEKVPFHCQLGRPYSHPMRRKLSSGTFI